MDNEDYERLAVYSWHLVKGYAATASSRSSGKRRWTYMHRMVMNMAPGDGRDVHHRNARTRDNRKANLMRCSRSLNLLLVKGGRVYKHSLCNRWQASLGAEYLGLFPSRPEARAACRDRLAERIRLEMS